MNPLFVLDDSIFEAISREEAFQCSRELKEAGVRSLPAPEVDVCFRLGALWPDTPRDLASVKLVVTYVQVGDDQYSVRFDDSYRTPEGVMQPPEGLVRASKEALWWLFASLAARNVVKSAWVRSPGKLTKQGQPKHTHVTTIRVPNVRYLSSGASEGPTGREIRPHFRRGHIRDQPYGQGRQERKRIWVAPLFVKGDPEFVSTAKVYRVTP